MSTVHHYRSNLRDIFFNLFEFLDVGRRVLGKAPFATLDEETAVATVTPGAAILHVRRAL